MLFNCLSVISMFCYNWLGQSYIRFYSLHDDNADTVYNGYLRTSLIAGTGCFIILSFIVASISPVYLVITIPVFIFSVYYNFNLIKTQALQQARNVATAEIIRTAITVVIPIIFIFIVHNQAALFILFGALLLAYAAGYFYLSARNKDVAGEISSGAKKNNQDLGTQIKNYGIPISFFVSISLALTVNDRYLIAHLIGYKNSGNYAAVYDVLYKGISFACAPVLMTFFPHIVRQFNDGEAGSAYQSIKKALLLELVIFLIGLAGLILFGNFLLEFLLKQPVTNDIMQLAYIIYTGVFIWQAAMLIHKPLELRLQTKYMVFAVFVAFAVNITANWFLLSKYKDVMIAAWTTLFSSLIYVLLILNKIFRIKND